MTCTDIHSIQQLFDTTCLSTFLLRCAGVPRSEEIRYYLKKMSFLFYWQHQDDHFVQTVKRRYRSSPRRTLRLLHSINGTSKSDDRSTTNSPISTAVPAPPHSLLRKIFALRAPWFDDLHQHFTFLSSCLHIAFPKYRLSQSWSGSRMECAIRTACRAQRRMGRS